MRAGLRRRRSRPRKCRVRGWGQFGERRSKRSTAHTFNRNENVPGQVAGRFSLPSIKAQSGFFQKLQMIQGVGNGFAFGVMVGVFPDCFKAHQNCCLGHLDAFEQARLVHFVQSRFIFTLPCGKTRRWGWSWGRGRMLLVGDWRPPVHGITSVSQETVTQSGRGGRLW